jgi:hypothetical protein
LEHDNAKYLYIYIYIYQRKERKKYAQEEKCLTESLTIVLEFETEDYRMEGTTLQAFAWKR